MNLKEIADKLDLEILAGAKGTGRKVTGGYVSDLLSDVIGNSSEGELWITIQTHMNIVAVAALKEHSGIVIAGGNRPGKDVIDKADEEGVPVLCSRENSFNISGRIYYLLNE